MAIAPGLLTFAEWKPDISPLNTGASPTISNAVPRADGYGPFQALQAFTQVLGTCRGFFFARNADGSVTIFAGTATDLYQLNNTTFGWTKVSISGGYSALPSSANWQFAQFNTVVLAVQVNTVPQAFTLGSSTAFANLGGSPPQAAYIAIINRFVMLGGLLGFPYRVQWSGLNAITVWDNVTAQSNFQDLADGGLVQAIQGGDQFGSIFQQTAIRSIVFAPGSAVVFDILRIASNDGILAPYAAVTASDTVFFLSPQGFKMLAPGGYPTPIGREKVDRTFFSLLDSANLQLLMAATDPGELRVYFAFKSNAGQAGLFDTIFVYDLVLQRWAQLSVSGQYIGFLAKPGLTLEALDAIAPGIITISGAANNGSGAIRLTLSGLTAGTPPGNTNLNVENTVVVYGVTGTTEANGAWRFTIIDSTHIDLIGSSFSHAYVSGGQIGGALDQLPFSLDSVSLSSLVELAAFDPTGALGFFNGQNLEAIMETPEQDGKGKRFFVSALRPMTDCETAMCSVAARDNAQAAAVLTTEVGIDDTGRSPVYGGGIDARYAKARVRMPLGATWTYAMGIEPEFTMTGER